MQAAAAEQLGKEYGVTKWGVLVENTPYGSAIADVFRERLQAKPGLQIVGEVGFEYSALEMTSEAAKLVAKGPEAIAVLSTGAPGGLAAKSVRMAGFKGPLLVVEPVVTKIAQMGPLLEGTMGATVFLPGKTLEQISQPRPAMKVVYEYWNKRGLGAPKGWWEPLGFEQVIILANAMKAVGPDRAKIQAYLDNNFVYEGVFGQVRFTPKQHEGLYIESFVILELINGVLVEHIPR
jgi:branched-chain amino acid transport system substrate-binding protein